MEKKKRAAKAVSKKIVKKKAKKRNEKVHVNRTWFEQQMHVMGLSMRALARKIGMDASSLHGALAGTRRVSTKEVGDIARALDASTGEVLAAFGTRSEKHVLPLVGTINQDGTVTVDRDRPVDQIEVSADTPRHAFVVIARTAGSALDNLDGALFVVSSADFAAGQCLGRLCIVSGEIAYMRRGIRTGSFNLVNACTRQERDAAIKSAAPVLWIRP